VAKKAASNSRSKKKTQLSCALPKPAMNNRIGAVLFHGFLLISQGFDSDSTKKNGINPAANEHTQW
jgi:hypothetical protein